MRNDLKTAAKNSNYWTGVTTVMPLVGGFLADSYTGRFFTILFSSFLYLMGLSLLTASQFTPSLKACNLPNCGGGGRPPRRAHKAAFYLAIYLISLATGGFKPCLESFGADQFDDSHRGERKQKMSFFNWWNVSLCCGLLLGVTVVSYVEEYVGWGAAAVVLTATMGISTLVFCFGRPFFRYRFAAGSPLTPVLQVIAAAVAKRKLDHPPTPEMLYEVEKCKNPRTRLLSHTNSLRFLDKAAIMEDDVEASSNKQSPWRLATVTQVEETKLVLRMVPIWLTSVMLGVCMSFGSTFFVKQSTAMDRHVGPRVEIPPASIYALSAVGLLLSVIAYEKILVPVLRKRTGNERGISILQRIGVGLVLNVVGMTIASVVERERVRRSGNGSPSMSVFWLTPQYMVLSIGDGFSLVGLQEFFYHQVPDSMRSLGMAFYLSVLGVGSFLSSFLISVVDRVTEKQGGGSWFGRDMEHSRVDKFYWLITAMTALDLCLYLFFAHRYTYKNVHDDNGDLQMTDSAE